MYVLNVWRTLCYCTAFFAVIFYLFVSSPLLLLNFPLRKFGVSERYLPGLRQLQLCARLLIAIAGIRVKVMDLTGNETLKSGAIYMGNHTSFLDPVLCMGYCPEVCRFIYKKSLNYVPLMGQVFQLYGNVPIDRGNREKAIESCNKLVKRVIHKHQYVMVFPEGTRSKTGELLPFKKGPFHMAQQAHAPIIPIVIDGASLLLPRKGRVLKPGTVHITLLPPIFPKEGETTDALSDRVRASMEVEIKRTAGKTPQQRGIGPHKRGFVSIVGPTLWTLFSTIVVRILMA